MNLSETWKSLFKSFPSLLRRLNSSCLPVVVQDCRNPTFRIGTYLRYLLAFIDERWWKDCPLCRLDLPSQSPSMKWFKDLDHLNFVPLRPSSKMPAVTFTEHQMIKVTVTTWGRWWREPLRYEMVDVTFTSYSEKHIEIGWVFQKFILLQRRHNVYYCMQYLHINRYPLDSTISTKYFYSSTFSLFRCQSSNQTLRPFGRSNTWWIVEAETDLPQDAADYYVVVWPRLSQTGKVNIAVGASFCKSLDYPPWNKHSPCKYTIPIGNTSSKHPFVGAMSRFREGIWSINRYFMKGT